MPKLPKTRRRGLGLLLILVLAAAGLWHWTRGDAASGAVDYQTGAADRGAITRTVSASGAVRALVTVEVGSQLSGQLAEIAADFNSLVKEGDLLARIDPQSFATRVTAAEADLAVAQSQISMREAAVEKAEAVLEQAQRDAARQEALAKRGTASESVLDNARTAAKLARGDLSIARAELDNARQVVKQRQAALDTARIDLERTEIRSPIDGIVIERAVDVGQTVAASLQAPVLFRIAQDLSQIQIEAQINEADIGAIRAGNPVSFTVDAWPERHFTGEVQQVRLSPTELANVVTYMVVIRARNPDQLLLPGMTATVAIVTGTREDALRVPNAALRFTPADADSAGERRGGGDFIAEIARVTGMTEAQQAALQTSMAERRASGPLSMGGPPPDPSARRGRMEAMLKDQLTDAQMEKWRAWQAEIADTRQGTLWVLGRKGAPERRAVRLGIGDDSHTEIIGGGLEPGDLVILRAVSRPQG